MGCKCQFSEVLGVGVISQKWVVGHLKISRVPIWVEDE